MLDEVTGVQDWEGWLARNHELLKGRLHLIVSSSRVKLVIPSRPLRGRMLHYEMYPLSFKEFLNFMGVKVELRGWVTRSARKVCLILKNTRMRQGIRFRSWSDNCKGS